MGEYTGILIAVLIMVATFIVAMNQGVVKLLSSGLAALVAMAVLFAGIHFLPILTKILIDLDLVWKVTVGISAGFAFFTYVVSRILFGMIVKRLFNHDGMLHRFVDGLPGGLLSLLPSVVVVFFLFNCIRIAGTLQELNYVDSLSRDGVSEMGGKIPPYPFSADWRNGVEKIPGIAHTLDYLYPFSRRNRRNAAACVLITKSTVLMEYLKPLPATGSLVSLDQWRIIAAGPGVAAAMRELDRVALVLDPAVVKAADEPILKHKLNYLPLRTALVDFVESLKPRPVVPLT